MEYQCDVCKKWFENIDDVEPYNLRDDMTGEMEIFRVCEECEKKLRESHEI
jgi:hypothetical protein